MSHFKAAPNSIPGVCPSVYPFVITLPVFLPFSEDLSIANLGCLLKTHQLQQYSVHRAHYRQCAIMVYANRH